MMILANGDHSEAKTFIYDVLYKPTSDVENLKPLRLLTHYWAKKYKEQTFSKRSHLSQLTLYHKLLLINHIYESSTHY